MIHHPCRIQLLLLLALGAQSIGSEAAHADAGNDGESEPPRAWLHLPESFSQAWDSLRSVDPRLKVEFSGGRVAAIYGVPHGGGPTPEESTAAFLAEFAGLFGVSGDELLLTDVRVPSSGNGPAYVTYEQYYETVPLDRSRITFALANQEGFPITFISSSIHPVPTEYLEPASVSDADAVLLAEAAFGDDPVDAAAAVLVVLPLGEVPEYAWAVDITTLLHWEDAQRVFISAVDGRVVENRPLVDRFDVITGTVTGRRSSMDEFPPDCEGNDPGDPFPLVGAKVIKLETGEYDWTDSDGSYILSCDGEEQYTLASYLESEHFRFVCGKTAGGPVGTPVDIQRQSGLLTCDDGLDFEWSDDTEYPLSEQAMNAWYWLHAAREWVLARREDHPLPESPILVHANYSSPDSCVGDCNTNGCPFGQFSPCGAAYNGSIAISNGGDSCVCDGEGNTARDFHMSTIVVHEFGHAIHGSNGSNHWKENWADAFAALVVGTSKIGENLCACEHFGDETDALTWGRDIDDDAQDELEWPSLASTPNYYPSGRSMAAAYWDMAEPLAAQTDELYPGKVLLYGVDMNHDGVDPRIALDALQNDDMLMGNNQLLDGSPNYETINEAFRRHDLAWNNVPYITISFTNSAPGDPPAGQDVTVAVTIGDELELAAVDPVKLRYRINRGPWADPVVMTPNPAHPDYIGTIDGSNTATGNVIDYYVRVESTDLSKQYTCLPPQAQFVFPGDVEEGYDPDKRERNYRSLFVTCSEREVRLATDFNGTSAPGWTSSPAGKWTHGAPTFTQYGEQPSFDYPFDNDGPSDSRPYCFYTHPTQSVAAGPPFWQLTSPQFDASGAAATLRFALWFYVRDGLDEGQGNLRDRFLVEVGDGTTWEEITELSVEATNDFDQTQAGAEQKVRWLRMIAKIPESQLLPDRRLRFTARRRANSAAVMEACVDEVRVWVDPCSGHARGDCNYDCMIDGDDIQPFVNTLFDQGDATPCDLLVADIDEDNDVDVNDVPPFVCLLLNLPTSCDPGAPAPGPGDGGSGGGNGAVMQESTESEGQAPTSEWQEEIDIVLAWLEANPYDPETWGSVQEYIDAWVDVMIDVGLLPEDYE